MSNMEQHTTDTVPRDLPPVRLIDLAAALETT
jgi:hypothetical protein